MRKGISLALVSMLVLSSCGGKVNNETRSSEPVKKNQDVMVVSSHPVVEGKAQIKPVSNNIESKNKPIHIKTENKQIKNNKKKVNKGYIKEMTVEATAYYLSESETGKSKNDPEFGITANGSKAIPGVTVAMSKDIPFNTIIQLPDGTYRKVTDRGGKIKKGKLDLLVSSRKEAIKFGRKKNYKIKIIKWGDNKTYFHKK